MKFTLTGQDIPMLLPTLLTDLLFAGKEGGAEIVLEEKNPAMAELLTGYGEVILRKAGLGGSIQAAEREQALAGADCVIYAGDPQAASRFFMDRSALESGNEKDPADQRLDGKVFKQVKTVLVKGLKLELANGLNSSRFHTNKYSTMQS